MKLIKKSIQLTLATLALLLAACSPAAMAQTPTVTSTPAPTTTSLPTATQPTIAEASPTTLPTQTEASATTPSNATATSATVPNTATTPAIVAAAPAQVAQYENFASPVDLLASYYNAVDRQEYERAYGYWQAPPLDYATFASGYADTDRVQLIVQPPTRIEGAAGSLYAEVPTVLVAQHTDGSTHIYGGCVVTRKSNLHPPDVPEEDVWHIYQARLEEIPNNISIPNMLAQACAS
jgi:hypothetical protein